MKEPEGYFNFPEEDLEDLSRTSHVYSSSGDSDFIDFFDSKEFGPEDDYFKDDFDNFPRRKPIAPHLADFRYAELKESLDKLVKDYGVDYSWIEDVVPEDSNEPLEVIVGLEVHTPRIIEEKKKMLEKSDIIIRELAPKTIKEFKDDQVDKSKFIHPQYSEKMRELCREMLEEGKIIEGIKGFPDRKGEVSLMHSIACSKGSKVPANRDKKKEIRDKYRSKYLKETLDKLKDKIPGKTVYIEAGVGHSKVYKELEEYSREEEDIEVEKIIF